MKLSDEKAVELVNLLSLYAEDSIDVGISREEVWAMPVEDLINDIIMNTPEHLMHKMNEDIIPPLENE